MGGAPASDALRAEGNRGPEGRLARTTRGGRLGRAVALATAGVGALLLAAGPGGSTEASPAATAKVKVTMTDYAFALSKNVVRRGAVVFAVVNEGEVVHDFKIAGKKTPIYETGQGGSLRVVFKKAGRYKYVCTVPGHVLAGMKGVLKVAP